MTTSDTHEIAQRIAHLVQERGHLEPVLDLETKREACASGEKDMLAEDFWSDTDRAQEISTRVGHLRRFLESWEDLCTTSDSLSELWEMAENDADRADIVTELTRMETELKRFRTQALLSGKYDTNNAMVSLHVGNGGSDAEDFCTMLLRMYLRYGEHHALKTTLIDRSDTDDGIRSAVISFTGVNAYGYLHAEHGVHRLIRLSPFNSKNLRQTSFVSVEVVPDLPESAFTIDESDLRFDVFRSSGAGGQSVNTTDSAVRVTHVPTGIIVTCQNEKSQHQNKASALSVLRGKLAHLEEQKRQKELNQLKGEKLEAAFGSQIRTYTLHPYKLVKDHRTNLESSHPEKVLDGNIQEFIEVYLEWKSVQ